MSDSRVLKFFNSTETPRWWLIAGAVLTIVLSFWASLAAQDHARQEDYKVKQVQNMLESTHQFQMYASAFAAEIMNDGKATRETKNRLIENLNEQHSRSAEVAKLYPETASSIEQYKRNIKNVINAVHETKDVPSMKRFWNAASDLIYSRKEVTDQLNVAVLKEQPA